jgi:hypothetical protein
MLRVLNSFVWSKNLDSNKATSNKLNVFELWIYRRILRISWTEKITNIKVLRRMGKEKELMVTV